MFVCVMTWYERVSNSCTHWSLEKEGNITK